jgi:hypothetical protein
MGDSFPVLQGRRRSIDRKVDEVRRVLWRAFQHGDLTDDEFATTLDRLEFLDRLESLEHPGRVHAEAGGSTLSHPARQPAALVRQRG